MTPRELEQALEQLRMSDITFGQLIKYDQRSVRSWRSGQYPIPYPVAVLARLLVTGRITTQDVKETR